MYWWGELVLRLRVYQYQFEKYQYQYQLFSQNDELDPQMLFPASIETGGS